MGIKTDIEWCDSSVNPTENCDGCELWNTKAGIRKCYAGKLTERFQGRGAFDGPIVLKPGRMAEKKLLDQMADTLSERDVQLLETYYNRVGKNRGQERTKQKWALRSYWDDVKGTASANGHVAAFPLEIPARHILLYTQPDEIVFEPFCGSGTTLIACEILNRVCRAIEIDAGYVAASLERWHLMTGETPERSS